MTNMFSPELEKKYDVVWDPTNGSFSICGGICRMTPELIEDLKSYYNLAYEELFAFVANSPKPVTGEIDVRIEMVPTFFRGKEAVWRISTETIGNWPGGKIKLYEAYFSSGPLQQ